MAMAVTEQDLRAKGYTDADIAYVLKRQKQMQQAPQQPQAPTPNQQPPKRGRDARTPYEFILALLRGHGV